jgi:hypothetical protein
MRYDRTGPDFVSLLLERALQHGMDSEPDHEVGDLQSFLVACCRSWLLSSGASPSPTL